LIVLENNLLVCSVDCELRGKIDIKFANRRIKELNKVIRKWFYSAVFSYFIGTLIVLYSLSFVFARNYTNAGITLFFGTLFLILGVYYSSLHKKDRDLFN